MSRAEKNRRKQHKKISYEKLNFKCPKCGMIVPDEAYESPNFGFNYQCSVCGTLVFQELRDMLKLS